MKIVILVFVISLSAIAKAQDSNDTTQGMFPCLDGIELAERFQFHMPTLYSVYDFKIKVNGEEMDGTKAMGILQKDGYFSSTDRENLAKSKGHLALAQAFEKAERARSEANYKLEEKVYTLDNRGTGDVMLTTDRSNEPERQKYQSPQGPDALVVKRGPNMYALTDGFMTRVKLPESGDGFYFIKVGSANNHESPAALQAEGDKLDYIHNNKLPKGDIHLMTDELMTKLGKDPIDLNLGRNSDNDTVQVLSDALGKIVNRIQDTFKAQMDQVAGFNDTQKKHLQGFESKDPASFAHGLLGHYERALGVCAKSDNKIVAANATATLENIKATFKKAFPKYVEPSGDTKQDGAPISK